jgi:hypothetical protein
VRDTISDEHVSLLYIEETKLAVVDRGVEFDFAAI